MTCNCRIAGLLAPYPASGEAHGNGESSAYIGIGSLAREGTHAIVAAAENALSSRVDGRHGQQREGTDIIARGGNVCMWIVQDRSPEQ